MTFVWHLLFSIANLIPLALAYSFLLGRGRVQNWGPVGAALVAAYGIFVPLSWGQNYLWAALIGLVLVSLVSLLYTWLVLRLPGDAFGVMAIAVHLAILTIVLNWTAVTRGALGIPNVPRPALIADGTVFILTTTFVSLLWIVLMVRIDRSSVGRQLTALGEHDIYARALGINRAAILAVAFLLVGAGTWIDTLFSIPYIHLLHPNDYQFPTFIFLLTIVIAARPGNIPGTVLSTALLVLLREGLRFVKVPMMTSSGLVFSYIPAQIRRDQLFPRPRTV
ncbi:branched-chain amino acid ABC transporter permease [Candidatus Peregrinibacteria bacterium]|nr:branched-chain amino acid ABC transporter permease [Candidatus Peregrinibacteria bacterium]